MNKAWRWLEKLPTESGVLTEWERTCGQEFERARAFLIPSGKLSDSYPCTHRFRCECEHRVVVHSAENMVAVCRCEERGCPSISVQPKDLVIHKLDTRKLGDAVCCAFKFGFGEGRTFPTAPQMVEIGMYELSWPVIFYCPWDQQALLEQLEGLFAAEVHPFLLVMPTRFYYTAQIETCLKRNRCGFIPLSKTLSLGENGRLEAVHPIDGILEEFRTNLARGDGVSILKGVESRLDALVEENRELREVKKALEQMQGENLLKFVQRLDARDFQVISAIIIHGDVAKASRALGVKDSTLRDVVRSWKHRNGPYKALSGLVEWRKDHRVVGKVPFNEALLYSKDAETNRESLFREILDGLLSMTQGNWQDVCEELKALLRDNCSPINPSAIS